MAADCNKKMSALFEEFKNRELQFLKTERQKSCYLNWEKSSNASVEDYLKKLAERERETARNYFSLMQQMEDLDKHADMMSAELEKLNALRNTSLFPDAAPFSAMRYPYAMPFESYSGTPRLNTADFRSDFYFDATKRTNDAYFSTASSFGTPLVSNLRTGDIRTESNFQDSQHLRSVRSDSTQTETMVCEHCNYPLTSLMQQVTARNAIVGEEAERVEVAAQYPCVKALSTSEHVSPEEDLVVVPSNLYLPTTEAQLGNSREVLPSLNPVTTMCDVTAAAAGDSTVTNTIEASNAKYHDNPLGADASMKVKGDVSVVTETRRPPAESEADSTAIGQPHDSIVPNDSNQAHDVSTQLHRIDGREAEDEHGERLRNDQELPDQETHPKVTAKSDDESINHEFDFLESDKVPGRRGSAQPVPVVRMSDSSDVPSGDKGDDRPPVPLSARARRKNSLRQQQNAAAGLQTSQLLGLTKKDDAHVDGESSVSIEPASLALNSDNASIVSESDSFSEKVPLTATAAYQALLGNASAVKVVQQRQAVVETDSEDEIERALAAVVKKPSNPSSDPLASQQKAEEKTDRSIENRPQTSQPRPSISAGSNKPQSKLSKNTRKVLGLETSSGSEIELEAKPSGAQKDDDSDEFDFYD